MSRRSLFISSSEGGRNRRFAAGAAALFLCVVLFCLHVFPQYSENYNASLIDKVDRLESIDGPKIVLIGNSNLAFGIDSARIEEAFGMPVVNMGLHAGAGNAFHEKMATLNVHEGDIYVLCHSEYTGDGIADPQIVWITVEDHPGLWRMVRARDIWPMVKGFPVYLKKCLALYAGGTGNQSPEGVYSRAAFNEYGDVEIERTENLYTFESPVNAPTIDDATAERINELTAYLENRGAALVIAGYPIGSGELTAPAEDFRRFGQELAESLDCDVISDFTDYFFPYDEFYNTYLHLTSAAAEKRTGQLIADLSAWMEADNYPAGG